MDPLSRSNFLKRATRYVTPNETPRLTGLMVGWSLVALAGWSIFKPTVFPSPIEVISALPGLWSDGLGSEVLSSLWVNIEALCLSALIGLPLAYLSRVPVLSPVASFVGKLRFVGSSVFFLPLLMILPGAHLVKVWLLTLGELFWIVTTMVGVVASIPDFAFDDAYTLRMSEWLAIWYVVVRGTVAQAIDAIRDNAAMGWSMLMFVEGVIRSEGGVGVVILNAEKHVNYDEFFAVVIVIVAVGIGQDWLLGQVKRVMCPYV